MFFIKTIIPTHSWYIVHKVTHVFLRMIWLFSFSSVSSTNFLGNGAQIGVLIDACRKRLFFLHGDLYLFQYAEKFFFLAHFPRRNSSNRLNLCRQKNAMFWISSLKSVIQVFFFPKMRLYWDLCKKDQKIPASIRKNSPKNNISQLWAVDQKLLWYYYLDINFIYSLRKIGNEQSEVKEEKIRNEKKNYRK